MTKKIVRKISDYWKDTRLNYSNVLLHQVTMQTSYMESVARNNADLLEDEQDTEGFHYWAAFADIIQTFNDGCCTGYTIPKSLEIARMKGMCDAFNSVITMMEQGEFME